MKIDAEVNRLVRRGGTQLLVSVELSETDMINMPRFMVDHFSSILTDRTKPAWMRLLYLSDMIKRVETGEQVTTSETHTIGSQPRAIDLGQ